MLADVPDVLESVSVGPCALHVPLTWPTPRAGQATRVDSEVLWVELGASSGEVAIGARVIVEGPWAVRVLGTVAGNDGSSLCIAATRAIERDRRAAPRVVGGVDVRYAVAADESEAEAWMSRGELPLGGAWYVPDPFMSFSATGLKFEHRAVADEGDLILLQISVPRRPEVWRATARVVRVLPIPEHERGMFMESEPPATHRVAVHFEKVGREAREALTARGLEIMRVRSRV